MQRMTVGAFAFIAFCFGLDSIVDPAPTEIFDSSAATYAVDYTAYDYPGEIVVDLTDSSSSNEIDNIGYLLNTNFELTSVDAMDDMIVVGYVDNIANAIVALNTIAYVESAEPRLMMKITGEALTLPANPNDPLFAKQWHMVMAGAPDAWTSSNAGKGIIVAVVDTGVAKVEDLENTRLLPGKSFVPREQDDGHGHGTHVAGTIAQTTNNGIGVTGMAPLAQILPVKVLSNSGGGQVDWIADGIDWASDNGAHIINMSLGGGYSPVIHNAVKRAREKGVLVVSACGNSSYDECDFPGGLKENIGVSALGPTGELSFYSSYGKGVDIAAPGGDTRVDPEGGVWQNTIQKGKQGYYGFQGTSMATPHVAGAAAVIMSHGLSADETEQLLYRSADGDEWTPKFGHGKMNMSAALKQIQGKTHIAGFQNWVLVVAAGFLSLWATVLGKSSREFTTSVVVGTMALSVGVSPLAIIVLNNMEVTGILATVLNMLSSPPLIMVHDFLVQYVWSGATSIFSFLWYSALFPFVFGWLFGINKSSRPLAVSYLLATAVILITLTMINPVTLLVKAWLLINVAISAFLAVGLIGVEKIDSKKDLK